MKKVYILAIIILIVGLILTFSIKPIFNLVGDSFWNFISTQLDKEEAEREKIIKEGGIIRGKDTVLIWENKFEIWHQNDELRLSLEINDLTENILMGIRKYKIIRKKLYIVAEEGYAIIDKDNLCRVYITIPPEEFIEGYSMDNEGIQHPISRFVSDEHVQYLSSYDDFATEEKAVFEKME